MNPVMWRSAWVGTIIARAMSQAETSFFIGQSPAWQPEEIPLGEGPSPPKIPSTSGKPPKSKHSTPRSLALLDSSHIRSITPDLDPHIECSYEHSLCYPSTSPAAPVPRHSGKSSTTAGTNSSPSTKNYTANPSARSTPPPSPPSNPFSAAATSPPASPARQAGGCRLEAGGDAR